MLQLQQRKIVSTEIASEEIKGRFWHPDTVMFEILHLHWHKLAKTNIKK